MGVRYDRDSLKAIPVMDIARLLGIKVHGKKALCFNGHDRRTPSLSFDPRRNIWRCFGQCGQGGDTIALVQAALGLSFREACEWLTLRFSGKGVMVKNDIASRGERIGPQIEGSSKSKITPDDFSSLPDPEIYNWLMERIGLSERGLRYLNDERGLTSDTIARFQIKDLQHPSVIVREAAQIWGVPRVKRCGLVKDKSFNDNTKTVAVWWDHTILFPFFEGGKIIYIQGRRVSKEPPKYIGLSGIRKPLFNADSLNNLQDGALVLICEGVPDTITAVQQGFEAVGVLGATSFDRAWIEGLSRFRLIVARDMDNAGVKFAATIQAAFRRSGNIVESTVLPYGKDLSDYYTKKTAEKSRLKT